MFCPVCRCEYNPGITECPDCDARLVETLPEEAPDVKLVCVASYPFDVHAQEAKIRLEAEGIESALVNERIYQTSAPIALADGGVKVVVREEDADRASKILEER